MSAAVSASDRPRRKGSAAFAIYVALLAALGFWAVSGARSLMDAATALTESRAALERLDRPGHRASPNGAPIDPGRDKPPFLRGKTINLAGASLQLRVEEAVRSAGGTVLSSQTDLAGPRAGEGWIGLAETLEIAQAGLQPLLYDLESGMPYLFVQSLSIQSPKAFGEGESGPMRVQIGVTAQWRDAP
jgi:general secretion pathway protein M